ncbi:MAG: LysM peptidoglycan-binding domain-containing protein, partial [Clostridiaceae bacterium]|nr:LysM peptidoglycan-binding domain-containing protein [Clostridiaceae bacterium]
DTLYKLAQRYNTTVEAIIAANPDVDVSMLRVAQRINIWPGCRNPKIKVSSSTRCIPESEVKLMNLFRMLWEQHITWTRLAIISLVFDLPDVNLVIERLLQNSKDFENALRTFYGIEASEFADLLTDHLVIAADLVKAAKAGDTMTADDIERRWYNNAREIAAFLASINPFWSRREWENMLFNHLALVKTEAVDMLNADYLAGINIYTEMERQALEMADTMSEGIIKQFPDKFQ